MTSKREIIWATAFKRDYKRLSASPRHSKDLDELLTDALNALVLDRELPVKNRDHALAGEWRGYRECHLKPDLLLVYQKADDFSLRLVRLGTHADLFE